MASIAEVLGIFACLFPVAVLIAYMAWATRRKRCPQCQKLQPADAKSCASCGRAFEKSP